MIHVLYHHWVEIIGILYAIDRIIQLIGSMTGNKKLDNLAVILGNILNDLSLKKAVK